MEKTKFSIRKRLKSFKYAFNGLRTLIQSEHNSRIHLFAAIAVILLGVLLKISTNEWIILSIVIGQVFICEIFNTCIETICNYISKDYHDFIKKAKDLAASAVLISVIISLITGVTIFLPKLLKVI